MDKDFAKRHFFPKWKWKRHIFQKWKWKWDTHISPAGQDLGCSGAAVSAAQWWGTSFLLFHIFHHFLREGGSWRTSFYCDSSGGQISIEQNTILFFTNHRLMSSGSSKSFMKLTQSGTIALIMIDVTWSEIVGAVDVKMSLSNFQLLFMFMCGFQNHHQKTTVFLYFHIFDDRNDHV